MMPYIGASAIVLIGFTLIWTSPALLRGVTAHAPWNARLLIDRVVRVILLLVTIISAASVAHLVQIPALAVTVYSLLFPVLLIGFAQPLLPGLSILIFRPYDVGEHLTAEVSALDSPITGAIVSFDLHTTTFDVGGGEVKSVPNTLMASAVITRSVENKDAARRASVT